MGIYVRGRQAGREEGMEWERWRGEKGTFLVNKLI